MEPATKKDLRDFEHWLNNELDAFEYRITVKLGGLIILFALLATLFQKII